MFVQITLGGIGRLDTEKTPKNILGIYTEDLEVCIAIFIIGTNRISLIHDTGRLSIDSILREIDWVADNGSSEQLHLYIAYNPTSGVKNLENKIKRIQQDIENKMGKLTEGKNLFTIPATNTFVAIDKEYTFNTTNLPTNVSLSPEKLNRNYINYINNWFLTLTETTPADLQFDVSNWTSMPTFIKDTMTLEKMLNEDLIYSRLSTVAPDIYMYLTLEIQKNKVKETSENSKKLGL